MKYVYFPGCSLKASAGPYEASIKAVGKRLGMELEELDDWNCCGATAFLSTDETMAFALSGRNLARAEKQGGTLVTPCSGCYATLRKADTYFHTYTSVREKMKTALAAGKLEYSGGLKIRHLLDVMVNDVGLEAISKATTSPLKGVKVAPYYGCQLTRPTDGFDDPEFPQSLDKLIKALGGEPTGFPMKSKCCGGALMASRPDLAFDAVHKLLVSAQWGGAQVIATACPLCQTNLEFFQPNVNKAYNTAFKMPVVYFTQLMGLAMGISPQELQLDRALIPVGDLSKAAASAGGEVERQSA